MKKYKYKGRLYSVVPCTLEDIPSHIGRVSSFIGQEHMEFQSNLLKECEGYQLVLDGGSTQAVIYYKKTRNTEVVSHLLWIRSKVMFAILAWYLREHKRLGKIYFQPHDRTIAFEYWVEPKSIRTWWSHDTPLVINLYSPRCEALVAHLAKPKTIEEVPWVDC